jgi:hypothetical protein
VAAVFVDQGRDIDMDEAKRSAVRRVLPPANPPDSTTKRKIRDAVRKVVAANRGEAPATTSHDGGKAGGRKSASSRVKTK